MSVESVFSQSGNVMLSLVWMLNCRLSPSMLKLDILLAEICSQQNSQQVVGVRNTPGSYPRLLMTVSKIHNDFGTGISAVLFDMYTL